MRDWDLRRAAARPIARSIRKLGLAALLAVAAGCAPAELPRAPASAEPGQDLTAEAVVGRWRGRVVEQHEQFVRYSFVAPGEPAVVVELTRRRPDHGREFGTEALAVQPAPGAEVTPELLRAVTAWLRAEGPGPDELFAAPAPPGERSPAQDSPAKAPRLVRSIGLGLLALWLLAWVASLLPARGRPRPSDPSAPRGASQTRLLSVGAALLIAAAVVGLRLICSAPTPLDDDALRDLAMGLACAAGDTCLHGATASFGGFEHGTGFPRLLGWLRSLGLGMRGLQIVLMTLSALAVGVIFDAGRRLAGPRHGWYAGALAAVTLLGLLLTELASTGDILWNPAAMALPAALTGAALVRGAATGRAGHLLLAGLFAGLAFEAHVSGLALWPGLIIVAAASARAADPEPRSPTLAALGERLVWLPAIAGAVAVTMLVSPASAKVNALAILDHLGWLACAAALVGTLALGFTLRWWLGARAGLQHGLLEPRAGSPPTWRPSAAALAVPILTLVATLSAAGGFVDAVPLRYLAPVFPAVALAFGWLAAAALARIGSARVRGSAAGLIAGLILLVTLPAYLDRMALDRDRWNYADLDTIAAFLRERGVASEDLHHALRGALCGSKSHGDRGQRLAELVVGGLRALHRFEAAPHPKAGVVRPAWLVAKLRNSELPQLPDGASALPSGPSHTIVMAPYQPLADLAGIRYCTRFEHGQDRCVPATPQPVRGSARQILPWHEHASAPARGASAVVSHYYELPLRWPADAPASRRATLRIDARSSSQAWRVVQVQGQAGVEGQPLPATTLELTLAPGASATLTLASITAPDGPPSPDSWWPPLVEVPDDPRMQALFLPPALSD